MTIDIKQIERARSIALEYCEPGDQVDCGNLFWALSVALRAYDAQAEKLKEVREICDVKIQRIDDLKTEIVALRSEVKEWFCESCRFVTTSPKEGAIALICSRCDSPNLMPRPLSKIKDLTAKLKVAGAAVKYVVDKMWFDKSAKNYACGACDTGDSGSQINADGHDHNCPVSNCKQTLAAIRGEKVSV